MHGMTDKVGKSRFDKMSKKSAIVLALFSLPFSSCFSIWVTPEKDERRQFLPLSSCPRLGFLRISEVECGIGSP
jgi:hypothetical protein